MNEGKYPLLGQNRQFRYSSSLEVRIYPLIPASGVTLLQRAGYEAALIDGVNSRMSDATFARRLESFGPDVIVMETKTPLMPRIWRLTDQLKERYGTIVFVGDHVTALPAESLGSCGVDYIITGGDYDLSLLGLTRYLNGEASEIPGGTWHSAKGKLKNSGPAEVWTDLDQVPFVDRELTNWSLYGEAYLQKPCTYLLTGRGCGGIGSIPGKCTFCSWQHVLWGCRSRIRSPSNVAEEIRQIVDKQAPKEIFDDNESGITWNPKWLKEFRDEADSRGLIGEVDLSSNSRADSLTNKTCELLSDLGFRLLKIGVESGNDDTLQRIGKMETVERIEKGVKNAKKAGLRVLLTVMVGYPWEGPKEVRETYRFIRKLMRYKAKIGDSLQASMVIPYPGTPLHAEAVERGLFAIDPHDYESYDMSRPVLASPIDSGAWCRKLWMLHYDSVFVLRCLGSLRSMDDLGLATKGISSLLGHARDFEG